MAETKVPAIKNIPAQVDRETGLALESMKEALEVRLGRRGDPKDRAVTLRELIDSGLATDLAQSPYNPNTGATGFGPIGEKPGDVTVPPAPTVLTASGLFTDVLLSWNQSTNTAPYGNHAFTEIWRSQAEDGIRDRSPSRGLGDVYKRQLVVPTNTALLRSSLCDLQISVKA